ncbi:endonuclease/exonuclease/phosphatase family metal-dependent hydrolase [Stackebrandtia albiflava]|uniref:Endonuclease/exonuclease/phosphatase family metal-dependent hydrolase n=1 Tax=Stackebrandtia albiflava TaxID=406432 RepID=A0A562VD78_9ACTN|nr:endonuclease/exonuclease/phosphatase family protein [Stackebrandtia albiflava]TWJ15822.1 endonuclease/exonuclease/phosphatase family metal-dependent hydrolase [Stackebrandtia albiflava]
MARLRVLTYNIHHGADAAERPSLDRIGRLIADSDADVVCLQEVDRNFGPRSAHRDQVAWLADGLAMHAHFGASITRRGGRYGNAILSRGALTDTRVHALPTPEGVEPRCAVSAVAATPLGEVAVFTTHLTVEPALADVRRQQLELIAGLVAETSGPAVVTGDFNTGSRRGELSVLEKAMHDVRRSRRFSPARWSLLWGRPSGATFPARWPLRRIDRIYVSGPLRVASTRVLPGRGSDHRALLAELRRH